MKLLLVILTGLVAGLLGALCGVGGGVVIVPALVKVLDFDQKKAVATSMAIIIIVAISATVNNQRAAGSLIDWRIVMVVGACAALAAWFGSIWMRELPSHTLTRLFGIVLLVIGGRMLWKP